MGVSCRGPVPLVHDLQPIYRKRLIIIDLLRIFRLEFPHYIPLFEKESIEPYSTLADGNCVTVRSSRGGAVGTASSPQPSIPVGLLSGLSHPSRRQDFPWTG